MATSEIRGWSLVSSRMKWSTETESFPPDSAIAILPSGKRPCFETSVFARFVKKNRKCSLHSEVAAYGKSVTAGAGHLEHGGTMRSRIGWPLGLGLEGVHRLLWTPQGA